MSREVPEHGTQLILFVEANPVIDGVQMVNNPVVDTVLNSHQVYVVNYQPGMGVQTACSVIGSGGGPPATSISVWRTAPTATCDTGPSVTL